MCVCIFVYLSTSSLGHMETEPHFKFVRQTGEAGYLTGDPWFIRGVVNPLHHRGSYPVSHDLSSAPSSQPLTCILYLDSLYCNQYGPRSDCSQGSSLIRVHNVCFHENFLCEVLFNICSRRKNLMTFSGQKIVAE